VATDIILPLLRALVVNRRQSYIGLFNWQLLDTESDHPVRGFGMRILFIFADEVLEFGLMPGPSGSFPGLPNFREAGRGGLGLCVRVVFFVDVGERGGVDIEVLLEGEPDD
jgi:hypothetical protein